MFETLHSDKPNEELLDRLFGTAEELETQSQLIRARYKAEEAENQAEYTCTDTNIELPESGSRYL